MTLDFDGNIFHPFVIHDDWKIDNYVEVIDKDSFPLGEELWCKIESWREEYSRFTSMNTSELTQYLRKIDELDNNAIELLKEISTKAFVLDDRVTCLRYFSLCRDKFLCEVRKNGIHFL